jgi:hypothetical protein
MDSIVEAHQEIVEHQKTDDSSTKSKTSFKKCKKQTKINEQQTNNHSNRR